MVFFPDRAGKRTSRAAEDRGLRGTRRGFLVDGRRRDASRLNGLPCEAVRDWAFYTIPVSLALGEFAPPSTVVTTSVGVKHTLNSARHLGCNPKERGRSLTAHLTYGARAMTVVLPAPLLTDGTDAVAVVLA